jgi:hypothetical protein
MIKQSLDTQGVNGSSSKHCQTLDALKSYTALAYGLTENPTLAIISNISTTWLIFGGTNRVGMSLMVGRLRHRVVLWRTSKLLSDPSGAQAAGYPGPTTYPTLVPEIAQRRWLMVCLNASHVWDR